MHYTKASVTLVQDDGPVALGQCQWMEYQKSQAAKAEAPEEPMDTTTPLSESVDVTDPAMIELFNDAAELCHEANRGYCESLGDTSQAPWAETPDWQKNSAIAGVQAIWDNPDITPEESHMGWLAQKTAEGWQHGEVKDAGAKTHPCIMPYMELPEDQRAKDTIFGYTARRALGLEVPTYLDVAMSFINGEEKQKA